MATSERLPHPEPVLHRLNITANPGGAPRIHPPSIVESQGGRAELGLDDVHAAVTELAARPGRFRIALDVNASFAQRCLASFGIVPPSTSDVVTFAPANNVEIVLRSTSEPLPTDSGAGARTDIRHPESVLAELDREADRMFKDATSREYELLDQYEWVSPGTYRLSTIRVPRRP